jgi:hypothetical protein
MAGELLERAFDADDNLTEGTKRFINRPRRVAARSLRSPSVADVSARARSSSFVGCMCDQWTRHGRPSDKGKRGAPQSACYGHATGGLSAYYPGGFSTVTAIFPARIFKILCSFFRPEFSYIFFTLNTSRACQICRSKDRSSSAIFELEDLGGRETDLRIPVAAANTNVAG